MPSITLGVATTTPQLCRAGESGQLRAFSSQPRAAAVANLVKMLYGGISSAAVQLPLLDLASAFPDLPPAPAHPPRFHCSQSSLRWDDYYCEFSIGAMFVTAIVSGLFEVLRTSNSSLSHSVLVYLSLTQSSSLSDAEASEAAAP